MLAESSNSWMLQLVVSPDFRFRCLRHGLLWLTTLSGIYRGFYFLAARIPNASPAIIYQYATLSTLFFGTLTVGGYWLMTTLTRQFILVRFRVGLFILGITLVHIITAELVLAHFWLFTHTLTLVRLPRFYTFYADHIAQLRFWQAPFDSVIVWFFSFSLVYNYMLYAVSLKVFKDLFTISLRQVSLEKENLRLEFDFLKAQINPHFLFNTLNNIYSFAVRSPQKVGPTILKLADLMRYTLYETAEERVPLANELAFLSSYVELQRIRHDEHVTIRFTTSGQLNGQKIPPLLLIVFVENAFKHGIQASAQASWVDIDVTIAPDSVFFQVANSRPPGKPASSVGIGLNNVQKRLHYLYPGRHQLLIDSQPAQYTITLTLALDESTVPGYRIRR